MHLMIKNWLCNARKFIKGEGWENILFAVFAELLEKNGNTLTKLETSKSENATFL